MDDAARVGVGETPRRLCQPIELDLGRDLLSAPDAVVQILAVDKIDERE